MGGEHTWRQWLAARLTGGCLDPKLLPLTRRALRLVVQPAPAVAPIRARRRR